MVKRHSLHIGLDNAGKTTVVKKFNSEATDTISPTLGFDIKTLEHRGYKLNIWDVGGQQTIRAYWRNYFEVTDGIVWVVDSADRWRLEMCRKELHGLLQEEVRFRTSCSLGIDKLLYAATRWCQLADLRQ